MAYLEGALELLSPSKDHEQIKSYVGRLIEAYALARGIDLSPYGAWTLKNDEVWVWKGDRIEIQVLRANRYESERRSHLLPGLDLDLLISFLDRPTALQAVKGFREALGRPGVSEGHGRRPGRRRRR
jgi:hypothetical protein